MKTSLLLTLTTSLLLVHCVSNCCLAQEDQAKQARSLSDPLPEAEEPRNTLLDHYVPPDKIVRDAFDPPPGAKPVSKRNVWIDRAQSRVYLDGYVAMNNGPLEMFACPMGTKEHESIVSTLGRSSEVHAALLAVGAQPGTPVRYLPSFLPATGQRIRVWVCYRDAQDKFQVIDGRRWVKKADTQQQMENDWVFAGSGFWKDPSDGREYYRADSGDMICVSNFSSAMLDIPISSSADAGELLFTPFTSRIPHLGTPVRLVLVPIPIPSDKPQSKPKADPDAPPGQQVLPRKSKASKGSATP